MSDRLRAGVPSRYVTSQLGRLSLASLRGRLIEYQLRLGQRRECHLCRVAGNTVCDPMWHVSSRSGVATLRTAMHLLLTYTRVTLTMERHVLPLSSADLALHSNIQGFLHGGLD